MTSFVRQVAVVTGAGSGIGRAVALALARNGAALVLVGRRTGPLEEVAREARTAARVHPADLSRGDDVRRLTEAIRHDFGQADVLVHSAAAVRMGTVAEATAEDFDLQYRTNVLGPHLLTQGLLPLLRERRGQVVFINSSAGLRGRAGVGQYAATKHALRALADSLRDEVNRDGVRVLSVYPGRTATPLQETLHGLEGQPYRPERLMQPEDVASVIVHALSLPGTAEVTDIHLRPMLGPG